MEIFYYEEFVKTEAKKENVLCCSLLSRRMNSKNFLFMCNITSNSISSCECALIYVYNMCVHV
jgi:hypothetical protein